MAGDTSVTSSKCQGGTSAAYLISRIKRDRPDIAKRIERGEFKSVRMAAIEAGIITPPTVIQRLRTIWRAASAEERAEFLKQVSREAVGGRG
ncbi:hypothetical protein [Methylobacterium sp. WL116]|uniref:hypothetical protein n=1 Tax=Methylobacterium sp. WL116 TaxID=2603889 RepID=UPI0011C70BCB|nr:hypothetical protein [Methylobacterium sp. WL116]TXM91986.1 hypothetical protein FV223_13315 [Methylobacterium sp. WL116]